MKFIIGFLITIGLLIFVFVLIFRGAGNGGQSAAEVKLVDYANTSKVMQFTEEGPVSADQDHAEVRITVDSVESSIEVFKGYQHTLVSSKTYPNNPTAYADFLRALDLAGYTAGNTSKTAADERGYCQDGIRYVMGIKDGDRDLQRFWATSCGGPATFKGKTATVQNLFSRQIPDYDTITNNVF